MTSYNLKEKQRGYASLFDSHNLIYFAQIFYSNAACAAANLAIGTRYGEQLT